MGSISGRDPATGNGLTIEFNNGKITALTPCTSKNTNYLSAGLVDLQVNGYGGIDFNDGDLTADKVRDISRKMLTTGVTTYLPTVITASETTIISALEAITAARKSDALTARMIQSVHIEGPFISPKDGPRGAHPIAHVRAPDGEEFRRWQAACEGLVGIVTLSPHWPGAPAFIRQVTADGVTIALGHTHASAEQIAEAVDAGAAMSTHLGNGAAAELPRHPNYIWCQMAQDRLTASFIADGHHLSADFLKVALRAKTPARSVLVSDLTALGGMAPGTYDQPIGGRVVLEANGRLGSEGTPYLAGAALPLTYGVATAMTQGELSLADALSLATHGPGRFVQGRGTLAIGADADIIEFGWREGDRSLTICSCYLGGEKQYENASE